MAFQCLKGKCHCCYSKFSYSDTLLMYMNYVIPILHPKFMISYKTRDRVVAIKKMFLVCEKKNYARCGEHMASMCRETTTPISCN